MLLIILALSIIFIVILWSSFWKIMKFMLSLTIGIPYRWYFDSPYKNEIPKPLEPNALWMRGTNGQYFRYDITVSDEDVEKQNDDLTNFYRQQERSR